jgi:hypothetical protein
VSAAFATFRDRLAQIQADADRGERIALMILNEYEISVWAGECPDRALATAEREVRSAWEG